MATDVVNLSAEMVQQLLKMEELIRVVEKGLENFSKGPEGGVVQPVRSVVTVEKPGGREDDG